MTSVTTGMDTPEQPAPITSAEAADALCTRLMATIGDLVALLERETGLLRRGQPQDIVALQARKAALSATLTRDMEQVRENAPFIKQAAPERIDAIKQEHAAFQTSLQANHDALSAMTAVSESLLRTIAGKVAEKCTGPGTYGKDAGLASAGPTRPAAISVDRAL